MKQAFTKTLIFWHFDPEYHIQIKTNTSSYAIDRVLSQLTSDQVTLDSKSNSTKCNLGWWHLVAYFSKKNDSYWDSV